MAAMLAAGSIPGVRSAASRPSGSFSRTATANSAPRPGIAIKRRMADVTCATAHGRRCIDTAGPGILRTPAGGSAAQFWSAPCSTGSHSSVIMTGSCFGLVKLRTSFHRNHSLKHWTIDLPDHSPDWDTVLFTLDATLPQRSHLGSTAQISTPVYVL